MAQIVSRVIQLLRDSEVGKNMTLKAGQELEIVMDVVYVNGNMVQTELQSIFYNWISNNPTLFKDVTKKY